MDDRHLDGLADVSLAGRAIPAAEAEAALAPGTDLLALVQAAWRVRRERFGRKVMLHILDNVQNGLCPEDCRYCAQGRAAVQAPERYALKPAEEILAEAEAAWRAGAGRHCLVLSGRGPSDSTVDFLADMVRRIKERCPGMELCVSPGLLGDGQAEVLKAAGLDRLNHNLNTTAERYPLICTTHGHEDRLRTVRRAKAAGLAVCSGFIVGLGEGPAGVVRLLADLRDLGAASIPVNFHLPMDGEVLEPLTPAYCLRVLCLARLMNPEADVRAAAGRELHLRGLQSMALFAVTSLFVKGYLNARGEAGDDTVAMILDAGFEVAGDAAGRPAPPAAAAPGPARKSLEELRPARGG